MAIPYLGHPYGRDSKYAKILDLYWHIKELISCSIDHVEIKKAAIMKKLEQLDNKFRGQRLKKEMLGDDTDAEDEEGAHHEQETGTLETPTDLDADSHK